MYSLSDEKEIDFAEQLESVAYVLCGEETISLDKFGQIFHAKGVSMHKFKLIIAFYGTNEIHYFTDSRQTLPSD